MKLERGATAPRLDIGSQHVLGWRGMGLPPIAHSILIAGCLGAAAAAARGAAPGDELSLDGAWETGASRFYGRTVSVPGRGDHPDLVADGVVWYRRHLVLPLGGWSRATLELHGARFAPRVYLDGQEVGRAEGGMAPVAIALPPGRAAPGRPIDLEIEVQGLGALDRRDASALPAADRWRTDVAAELWDDVSLHFSGPARLERVVPWTEWTNDRVDLHWSAAGLGSGPVRLRAQIVDPATGAVVASSEQSARSAAGVLPVPLDHRCRRWSPEDPKVYRLQLELRQGGSLLDRRELNWGWREFRAQGLGFTLNGKPVHLRGATVVWHRWLRDPEAPPLAWDVDWFQRNVAGRLKAMGGNFLRFHLGLPPERLLDLCDRDGLMVQAEWLFFHGVKASPESMERQWRSWLDVAARHPCVVLVHPWNETEGDELKTAWAALDRVLPEYAPWVVAHRDEVPVHKYWWSLFENLGLYYDSAAQFGRPVVVDEFGGNYLDGRGEMGAYPAVRESYLRFLGRDSTPARRLAFQAEANAKVAEYWRRLGAAGVAPFCTLSSPQDGNHWFLGALAAGRPKPVWAALSAAYAPVAASLELWDRNFLPGQRITVPVHVFNESDQPRTVGVRIELRRRGSAGPGDPIGTLTPRVPAHGKVVVPAAVALPGGIGEWTLAAIVDRSEAAAPAVSEWNVRTLRPAVPKPLRRAVLGLEAGERELADFARQNGLATVPLEDSRANLVVLSARGWQDVLHAPGVPRTLEAVIARGGSVALLDVGPRDLGAGYHPFDASQLEGAPRIAAPATVSHLLFAGISATFTDAPEPESHFHPAAGDRSLWSDLPVEATWMWNGLRGGLVVPAADMEVSGLGPDAFAALWAARGADPARLRSGQPCFALRLADYFAFTDRRDDRKAIARLKAEVAQRAEDAPALQDRINPAAPVEVVDLAAGYRLSRSAGQAQTLIALASAGKNLSRTPVVELRFGPGRGRVILSQVLTAGRLVRGTGGAGLYDLRYDPAAEQFTLNLLAAALSPPASP